MNLLILSAQGYALGAYNALTTVSRTDEYKEMTLEFLRENGIRYDEIMFNMPMGERIVVNDRKPSGIDMAVAVNVDRDEVVFPVVERVL